MPTINSNKSYLRTRWRIKKIFNFNIKYSQCNGLYNLAYDSCFVKIKNLNKDTKSINFPESLYKLIIAYFITKF